MKKWSKTEEELLRINYPLMGYRVCQLFPSRSKYSVLRKSDWMELKVNRKLRKEKKPDKIGYFDIEASQLNANFGFLYSWSIKPQDSSKVVSEIISRKEILEGTLDKRIVKDAIEELKKYTLIYSYYGSRFDFPFLRTRALDWGLEFIPYGELEHRDLYYLARSKLRLNRNRLENVCDLLGIKGKTHLEPRMWVLANTGNQEALNYILNHNIQDVLILEKVHQKLAEYEAHSRRFL